jgi:hypothetical protein
MVVDDQHAHHRGSSDVALSLLRRINVAPRVFLRQAQLDRSLVYLSTLAGVSFEFSKRNVRTNGLRADSYVSAGKWNVVCAACARVHADDEVDER